jgi:hypothetical protein
MKLNNLLKQLIKKGKIRRAFVFFLLFLFYIYHSIEQRIELNKMQILFCLGNISINSIALTLHFCLIDCS